MGMKANWMYAAVLLGLVSFQAFGQDAAENDEPATTEATAQDCLGLDEKDWRYPEDKATATEKNAYYSDMMRAEQYEESLSALRWFFTNAPDFNPSIYINGSKIFEALGDATEDKEAKYAYYDSALWCYDQRIYYFCDSDGGLLNRRAFYNFKFYYRDGAKYPELYETFWATYNAAPDVFNPINIVPFMTAATRMYDPLQTIEAKDVLEVYDNLSNLLTGYQEKGAMPADKVGEVQTKLDGLLAGALPMDEQFIEENFCAKFANDGTNVDLAKKIVAYSLSNKATDNACFIDAAKVVFGNDPTDAMARTIADKHLGKQEYDSAIVWYENALELMEDNIRKSELYYSIANIYRTKGQYSSARSAALKGVEEDPTNTNHFLMIGDLYASSFQSCKGGENLVHDRAVFIAAYNWYAKAGDSQRMATARAQFPSKEEIFSYNMAEGQQFTVGCWINETVSIQSRN